MRALVRTFFSIVGIFAFLIGLRGVASVQAQIVEHIPVEGDQLRADTRKNPSRHSIKLRASKQIVTTFPYDPTVLPSQLLFVWNGANAARSELITLDPAMWRGLGNPPGTKGYFYKDRDGTRGGVKKIVYKQTSTQRKMKVVVRGEGWPWKIGGPHDSAQVHFHIGARRLCAEFGGDISKNELDRFRAKRAPEPAICPAQTCGNGITESPEVCDDGNLVDSDGCANDCSVGSVACSGDGYDPGLDPGPYSLADFHTHCAEAEPCAAEDVESLQDGNMLVATASLEHYAIAATLGDPIPPGAELFDVQNETNRLTAERSDQVVFLASLDCLKDTPASDPGWLTACLADADQWLAAGAVGFKDHAGATFDNGTLDTTRWAGAYNRLAGWCSPSPASTTPNRDCMTEPGARFPLMDAPWRDLVRELVEVRAVPLLTHAIPWITSPEMCTSTGGGLQPCHDVAKAAVFDFAAWAVANLTPQARRRIVLAHLGYFQDDLVGLRVVLDAGLSVDLAQPILADTGCILRQFVADYPTQIVLGTDIRVDSGCAENSYRAWCHGLMGPAGVQRSFANTCRGTMETTGAGLGHPAAGACGIAVAADAGERVAWKNAIEILGLSQ